MANGRVEIHDLFSDSNGVSHSDHKSTSDTVSMEDTVEFRLIMAYARRRRSTPKVEDGTEDGPDVTLDSNTNGTASDHMLNNPEEEKTTTGKKKKKKQWKRMLSIFKCVQPQRGDEEEPKLRSPQHDVSNRCLGPEDVKKKDRTGDMPMEVEVEPGLEEVVSRLAELADDVPLVPPVIESDAPESPVEDHAKEVETLIGLLLRESGDRLNEQQLKDANITADLFWNYSFFRSLINCLLARMGLKNADPDAPGPQTSPKTQMAVTCEVTSRLTAVQTLPMSRLLDHGARYLQDYYSPWARQQGGYEAAFEEDEDEVQ